MKLHWVKYGGLDITNIGLRHLRPIFYKENHVNTQLRLYINILDCNTNHIYREHVNLADQKRTKSDHQSGATDKWGIPVQGAVHIRNHWRWGAHYVSNWDLWTACNKQCRTPSHRALVLGKWADGQQPLWISHGPLGNLQSCWVNDCCICRGWLIRGRLYSLHDKKTGRLDPKSQGNGSKEQRIQSRPTDTRSHRHNLAPRGSCCL